MSYNYVVVKEKYELLALHRGLLEARFCDNPNDIDVFLSPILSKIHRNVVAALIEIDDPLTSRAEKWKAWLVLDEKRREWAIAVNRAKLFPGWHNLSRDEKIEASRVSVSPFELTEEKLLNFIKSVDDERSSL
jgi:hypothetical protein